MYCHCVTGPTPSKRATSSSGSRAKFRVPHHRSGRAAEVKADARRKRQRIPYEEENSSAPSRAASRRRHRLPPLAGSRVRGDWTTSDAPAAAADAVGTGVALVGAQRHGSEAKERKSSSTKLAKGHPTAPLLKLRPDRMGEF
ncbi:hypothetical protein MTO96_049101 [Rhipicephalus appendiculatus]